MFTQLVTNLQSLISTRFLVANFFPTLAFWFGNAAMLYHLNAPFYKYVTEMIGQKSGLAAIISTAALAAVTFTAYAESALLPTIQSLMEGNWHQRLVSIFSPAQVRRYERLEKEIDENRKLQGSFGAGQAEGRTLPDIWQNQLFEARKYGRQHAHGVNGYTTQRDSAQRILELSEDRLRSRPVSADKVREAVTRLVFDLRQNDADQRGPDNELTLDRISQLLWDLIDYANDFTVSQFRLLTSRRESSYGSFPLAPTRMGNVAKSVQRYAIERYNFNFELFWSRLQFIIQRDKDFGSALREAKTQLDFLISCSALTLLWAMLWAVWLYASSGPRGAFYAIAILGPLVAYGWYSVAVVQYRTLADLLRSSIDLFRLDLIQQMQYQRPETVSEERAFWDNADRLHALYEPHDLRLATPKST